MGEPVAPAALWSVTLDRPVLLVRFEGLQEIASWAVVGGGRRQTRAVAWLEVRNADLTPSVDPVAFARDQLIGRGLGDAVGFLTSRRIDRHHQADAHHGTLHASALATVGLSNALRVGDPPGPLSSLRPDPNLAPLTSVGYGTINVLVAVSARLSEAAAWEAMSIAAEARTAAVLDAGFPSRRSGAVATGTGTDCLALAWPADGSDAPTSRDAGDPPAAFAGKHTAIGHLIGETVFQSVKAGVAAWLKENWPGRTP